MGSLNFRSILKTKRLHAFEIRLWRNSLRVPRLVSQNHKRQHFWLANDFGTQRRVVSAPKDSWSAHRRSSRTPSTSYAALHEPSCKRHTAYALKLLPTWYEEQPGLFDKVVAMLKETKKKWSHKIVWGFLVSIGDDIPGSKRRSESMILECRSRIIKRPARYATWMATGTRE